MMFSEQMSELQVQKVIKEFERLGAARLAAIVMDCCHWDHIFTKRMEMIMAREESGDKLHKAIVKQLTSIGKSTLQVKWNEQEPAIREIDDLRHAIGTLLSQTHPSLAIERLWDFLYLWEKVRHRLEGDLDEAYEVFELAFKDLRRLYCATEPQNPSQLAEGIHKFKQLGDDDMTRMIYDVMEKFPS